jgi:glycosyltransferase involved in cell wall biosynthesis
MTSVWTSPTRCRTRQDAALIYAASDITGLTSHIEGLPCALLEAGASELPLSGSKIRGIPEVVEDGSNGLLFESGNAMGLAHALDRLVRDRNLREFMGQGGVRARDLYALDSYVDRLLAVYGELLE